MTIAFVHIFNLVYSYIHILVFNHVFVLDLPDHEANGIVLGIISKLSVAIVKFISIVTLKNYKILRFF